MKKNPTPMGVFTAFPCIRSRYLVVSPKIYNGHDVQWNARRTPWGWGFFPPVFVEASLNKNPTLDFILFLRVILYKNPKKIFRGGVFYQEEIEASLNKNPTPWGFSRHSPVTLD